MRVRYGFSHSADFASLSTASRTDQTQAEEQYVACPCMSRGDAGPLDRGHGVYQQYAAHDAHDAYGAHGSPASRAGPTPAPTPFPGPGIYEFRASPGVLVSPYTAASRYVIRGDGTFVLQFPTLPNFEVQGKYREADGRIIFDFDWNAQQAGATGVFSESEMTVTYNGYMSMSDFENGVYVKTP